jgi:hypothetical protein
VQAFAEFDLWLAAENGMFLRHTHGDWMTTMPEHLNMDWVESVQVGFLYHHDIGELTILEGIFFFKGHLNNNSRQSL